MTKLSKSILTITIISILSISFIPQFAKAETNDTIDMKQLNTITLQTAYNKYMDFTIKATEPKTSQKFVESRIMSDLIQELGTTYKVNSDNMLSILFSGHKTSILYQAQYKKEMDRLNKLYSDYLN
jgi:hypothetical protein